MQKREALNEKLVGGGMARIDPDTVATVTQGDRSVFVTLTDGKVLELLDETLNVTDKQNRVVPYNTVARINAAMA